MNIFGAPKLDFLAIGDITIDNFIKLKEAEIEPSKTDGRTEICLGFGDKVPYEETYTIPAVGNSPNAAVAAARLGLKTGLVSNLGDDEYGRMCLAVLHREGVDTRFVKSHPDRKTNYHYVLWYADDRTILIKHEDYPYTLPKIGEPKWIYLSSMGEHSLPLHTTIADYLESHPNIKLAFQPGTYQIRFGAENLARIYKRAELFFCNKEEAEKILKSDSTDIKTLAKGLRALGPKTIFITDGVNGAYVYENDKLSYMPVYPDIKAPYERTGAGDAFSSTTTVGISLGLSAEEAMKWGMVNAMSVIQKVGAQAGLLTQEKIKEYLAKAPTDYKATEI